MSAETLTNPAMPSAVLGEVIPGWNAPLPEAAPVEPTAGELLERRVDQAIEDCPFKPIPELRQGVESFYGEHYALDQMISDTLEADVPTDEVAKQAKQQELEAIVGRSIFSKDHVERMADDVITRGNEPDSIVQIAMPVLAALRLKAIEHPDEPAYKRAELMGLAVANQALFNEAGVAVTTLNEADKQKIVDNQAAIKAKIQASGLFHDDRNLSPIDLDGKFGNKIIGVHFESDPLRGVERAEEKFWEDTRFAGQLLFHNSYVQDEIWKTGSLMPRRVQQAKTGKFNTKNMEYDGDRLHSPTPHWSEEFDDYGYRNGDNPGTIAVPFAELIKTTPYGRGAEYGVLELKDDALESVVPKVTINDGITSIGGGRVDMQGRYGTDRTFYQSPNDVSPDAPLEEAPDGYTLKLNEADTWVQLGEEVNNNDYGTGQGYPDRLIINVPDRFVRTGDWEQQGEHGKRRQAIIADTIRQLQHDNIRKYGNKLVVPVRANVMNFYVEDDGRPDSKQLARFSGLAEVAA